MTEPAFRVSHNLIKFTEGWEGYVSHAQDDGFGTVTVGYGTTNSDRPVHTGQVVSQEQAEDWLRYDLNHKYVPAIPKKHLMHQPEIDLLADFAYNEGIGAVHDREYSDLAKRLRSHEGDTLEGRKKIYKEELPRWERVGSDPHVEGLAKRREAELKILNNDYSGRP